MQQAGLRAERVTVTEPLSYLDFLTLQRRAAVVITDSGGVQEETTYLGVPCLTMRNTTERPITVTLGTNQLLGDDTERMQREVARVMEGHGRQGTVPPFWDGHAAERIADVLVPQAARD
jgi:UDP-N-acetylglucosamine 2-epimerase (non-hydrolysing)